MPLTTSHLVDPELKPLLAVFPPLNLSEASLAPVRATVLAMAQALPLPPDVVLTEHSVPDGPDGNTVRVLVYTPTPAQGLLPAVLHVHGGGYVLGNPEGNEPRNARIAAEQRCVVVSVDYRLAPETRAPGSVGDCYAVLRWMNLQARELGIDRTRIGVFGESAGGGLSASLAIMARDKGEFPLAFQVLIYPMLDDRTALRDDVGHTGEFIWTNADNHFGWSSLLGVAPGSAQVPPYAVPARVDSVAGLPPTYMAIGALDLFLDEDLAYAQRLAHAGVPVELHVYPGGYHAFDMVLDSRVGKQFDSDLMNAFKRLLAA